MEILSMYQNQTKLLGLDLGTKKTGIAISDISQTLARALMTVPTVRLSDEIKKIIQLDCDISAIVVGVPYSKHNNAADKTKQMALEIIDGLDIPLFFQNEKLSSWEARELLKEMGYPPNKVQELEDQVAAQIILQEYLDSRT